MQHVSAARAARNVMYVHKKCPTRSMTRCCEVGHNCAQTARSRRCSISPEHTEQLATFAKSYCRSCGTLESHV